MLTLDFFKSELKKLDLTSSDADLLTTIRSQATQITEDLNNAQIIDNTYVEFKTVNFPIVDNSITIFRSSTKDAIYDSANILTQQLYDYGSAVTWTAQYAIDFANGYILFQTPYNPKTEFISYRYSYVNLNSIVNKVLFDNAVVDDRVEEEERGNVRIKFRSLLDMALKRQDIEAREGAYIEEINFTRLSHGKVYGADPTTGKVLP